jgi:glutamine synthetase
MTTAKDALKMIADNDVKYVDFRFTDPRGKWQHVTFDVGLMSEDTFSEGQMFDGSSIAGWKAINESDMCLMPDPATATIDPFFAETTMVLVCDVHQEGLFPGTAAGFGAGHALGDARGHGQDGLCRRKAPPRGGLRAARARP